MLLAAFNFDTDYAIEIVPELLGALLVTVEATVWGTLIALTLGLAWAIARRSRSRWLSAPAASAVEFIRSTPLLVQLFFLYYVLLPAIGLTTSPMVTGVVGLGVHYSTYASEVYRAGIDGVARGQWEAAIALNLSRRDSFVRVILPQAIPPVVPALGNYVIAMFKDTPMLCAITVLELLGTAREIGSERFSYLEPITLAGAMLLLVSLIASQGVRAVERKLNVARVSG